MKIALGIVRLFPGGGLQRDCLRIAQLLRQAGHDVRLFTSRREGDIDPTLPIELLPVRALSNPGIDLAFAHRLAEATRARFDCVVGFNKLLDLDWLYCADPCVLGRERGLIARLLPRHRVQVQLEAASFAPQSRTRIIALTNRQADDYRGHWNTPAARVSVIPPGVNPSRHMPELRADRAALRTKLGIDPGQQVWLWIGTQPHTKGLDRVLGALSRFEHGLVLAVGLAEPAARQAARDANALGVGARFRSLGYRDDIPALMAAADLLVHPARLDITGGVILEAVVNGLPVVTTDVCGFAEHVTAADAGIVVGGPFSETAFAAAVGRVMEPAAAAQMSANGARYGANPALYAGLERAVDLIVKAPRQLAVLAPHA